MESEVKYKNCKICDKQVYIQNTWVWVYKTAGIYYCSWRCYREAERRDKKKKKEYTAKMKNPPIANKELVNYRKSLNLTQEQLGLLLGVGEVIICRLETGERRGIANKTKATME